jgi:signal transduction histidine kinase
MKRNPAWSYEWVYYLTVTLFSLAVILRTLLVYDQVPDILFRDLVLVAAFLVLFLGEPAITSHWRPFFFIFLLAQMSLVSLLLLQPASPEYPDYFAILFALLTMRVFRLLPTRPGLMWAAAFTLITSLTLSRAVGLANALAFGLIYTAANALTALFSLNTRLAGEAHLRNQAMQAELQNTNLQLQAYSEQLKHLAIARERNRLARELHDSVTQTVFSMTLTTQSALLLLDRNPAQVKVQLDHLSDLARSAIAEMQTLISQLAVQKEDRPGLAALLRQHLAGRMFPEGISVSLKVEGNLALAPDEPQVLFRIYQEALNNIVKHAQASQACLSLHLIDPPWIEIEDNGRGFQLEQAGGRGGIGLSSMRERAVEIGWDLQILTSPGAGTHIRVKRAEKEAKSARN